MIPQHIAEFVNGPVVVTIGSRDAKLRPRLTSALGVKLDAAAGVATVFVQEARIAPLLPDLRSNGRIAMYAGSPTHEAYQFKGRFEESRSADEKETAFVELSRSQVLAFAIQCGYPEQLARPWILGSTYLPAVAVRFRVEHVFVQTPGPEAGKELV